MNFRFVPVNSELDFGSAEPITRLPLSAALLALSSVVIPTPQLNTAALAPRHCRAEEAAQIYRLVNRYTLVATRISALGRETVPDRGTVEMDQWTRRCRGQHRGAAVR